MAEGVDRGAEGADHLSDIGAAALAAFDLEGRDPGGGQLGQQAHDVEAGWFLKQVVGIAVGPEAALAQGGISRRLVGLEQIDRKIAEPRDQDVAALFIAHMAGR